MNVNEESSRGSFKSFVMSGSREELKNDWATNVCKDRGENEWTSSEDIYLEEGMEREGSYRYVQTMIRAGDDETSRKRMIMEEEIWDLHKE